MIKKILNKNLIVSILIIVLFFFIIKKTIIETSNRNDVVSDFCFTKGGIIFYSVGGEEGSVRLEYKYTVNGKIYTREILRWKYGFEYCCDHLELCKDKLFWVAYSRTAPQKSLLDLSKEIQHEKNPIPPKSLDKFE